MLSTPYRHATGWCHASTAVVVYGQKVSHEVGYSMALKSSGTQCDAQERMSDLRGKIVISIMPAFLKHSEFDIMSKLMRWTHCVPQSSAMFHTEHA